ncbi:ubiquitin-like-conjugating enzyme ATG10 [Cicer arietinum]|uniref:Ubiquitin-like-conjugating enzyme ATG10 n=1 Tax=Cicer arietinum TaxID=3827 RepID=A0A1S2YUM5_CICAR|nr:ubiquitin-like-conjugating enzyme ATG10 [Cicer arietinum]
MHAIKTEQWRREASFVTLGGMDFKEAVKDKDHWDGTLSLNDFSLSASTFSDKWKMFNPSFPPWLWTPWPKHRLSSSHKEGYLSLENVCLVKSHEKEKEECNISLTCKEVSNISHREEEPFDHATLVCPGYEVNHYDFHIVYSPSFRVPVLYFRSYHSDGQPLPFSEIEKDLPGHSAELLLESKWTFITQEEHPYLNRPWYKLHPCGTTDWMKLLCNNNTSLNKNFIEQYLVSWFSVVGQVVGLKTPLGMLDTVVSNES